jgi:uncharacterized OB-fold protein
MAIPVARDETSTPFFDGTAQGRFPLRRCEPSGHLSRPQARQCSTCGSTDLGWVDASGEARLISWAVLPSGEMVAIGELAEGPWWWTKLVAGDASSLTEGTPLRIAYQRDDGSEAVPIFELA